MITASPVVITAGAASGLLAVRAAGRPHSSRGGSGLFAASVAARCEVSLVEGIRPALWAGAIRASVPLAGPGTDITHSGWPGGRTVRLLPVLMSRRRCLIPLPHWPYPAGT